MPRRPRSSRSPRRRSPPRLLWVPPPASRAFATPHIVGGAVTSITVTYGGEGYNWYNPPAVSILNDPGGAGINATAVADLDVGVFGILPTRGFSQGAAVPQTLLTNTTAAFMQPAMGSSVPVSVGSAAAFTMGETVTVAGGGTYTVASITLPTTVSLTNLGIAGNAAVNAIVPSLANVSTTGGDDFGANVSVTFTGGGAGPGFTPATGTVTGSITSIKVTNTGQGYTWTSPPIVTITDSNGGTGSGATAVAFLTNPADGNDPGAVISIVVTNAGSGYTDPIITISAPNGTVSAPFHDTQATAVVNGMSITGVIFTAPNFSGSGYTSPPTVPLPKPPVDNHERRLHAAAIRN